MIQKSVYGWEKDSEEGVRLYGAQSELWWSATCVVELKERIGRRVRDN